MWQEKGQRGHHQRWPLGRALSWAGAPLAPPAPAQERDLGTLQWKTRKRFHQGISISLK